MEGLGGAASVMAVVSLAIQLVDSVCKIRRFLRSVSDAPKELKRIFDLLEQLESILEQIAMLVEKQQTSGSGETDIAKNILRAIQKCESKLCGLESLIERTMQELSTSSIASKTIGSFKLACKKNDIRDFENQLHDAVNLLNLTMMVNLTYIHLESMGQLQSQVSTTNQTANAIMQEMALIRVGFASDNKSN